MATIQLALTDGDQHLVAAFAGCSLDEKPGSNWVQAAGGLPTYICEVARGVKKSGKTTSEAIAIAVSRMKVWATGKGVDSDTQAKAAQALAQWEKLRAKSHAKSDAKKVKASVEIDMSDAEMIAAAAAAGPCHGTATDAILLSIPDYRSAVERLLTQYGG